jgi:hypothetical protein
VICAPAGIALRRDGGGGRVGARFDQDVAQGRRAAGLLVHRAVIRIGVPRQSLDRDVETPGEVGRGEELEAVEGLGRDFDGITAEGLRDGVAGTIRVAELRAVGIGLAAVAGGQFRG